MVLGVKGLSTWQPECDHMLAGVDDVFRTFIYLVARERVENVDE